MLSEFTATHSSESIKQLAAGVSGFFSKQLLWSTAPEKGAENNHTGLKGLYNFQLSLFPVLFGVAVTKVQKTQRPMRNL